MITIFNRKEVITTYDVEEYANARDDLKEAGIEFKIRTKRTGYGSVSAGKGGSIGRGISASQKHNGLEYTIYVKEEDYHRAMHIIHNKEGWK